MEFSRNEIEDLLQQAGFVDVNVETAFGIEKDVESILGGGMGEGNTQKMTFPFLICMGKKP
jgi:hypothetical protein